MITANTVWDRRTLRDGSEVMKCTYSGIFTSMDRAVSWAGDTGRIVVMDSDRVNALLGDGVPVECFETAVLAHEVK